jgi:lipoyl(octanoyl) transferase
MSGIPAERAIEAVHLPGLVSFSEALDFQVARRSAVETGEASNAVITLEHRPVITCGRHTKKEHLLHPAEAYTRAGIEVIEVDRGGDVTYHGPGQLTAYPILNLAHWTQSVNWYLRQLEEVIIATLGDFGIDSDRLEGYTGVWTKEGKIAQIGIGVHRWVTFHGVAINVEPDMRHFAMIIPCGIPDKPVVSMNALLGEPSGVREVAEVFTDRFTRHFIAL